MAESETDGGAPDSIRVEVVYARPEAQVLLAFEVASGSTVEEVIKQSGIADRFPEIGRTPPHVGIFGKETTLAATVRDGDRIEIYRPLVANPREQRRARAKPRGGRKPRRS